MTRRDFGVLVFSAASPAARAARAAARPAFPGTKWDSRPAAELGLEAASLDELATALGGRGSVVRHGLIAKEWGSQSERSDILSSAKPILSTLLFWAVREKRVASVDTPVARFGWDLEPKDRGITFRHLGAMSSGYARPEGPGKAWAYNDYAIQLYQKTLFDKVFREDPEAVANSPKRLGALGLEDRLAFRATNRRISASVRDFARIGWFWLSKGNWGGKQLLPRKMFDLYQKPQAPPGLPQTAKAETRDYLKIGTYGGGSDHFTEFGAGIYGFNWWFNRAGRLHPDRPNWPDAPADTFMSIGAGGNCSVMIPSLGLVLVSLKGNWGKLQAGDPESMANRHIRLLARAARA
jgi:CubicO group peptidase (beta-lactamase class C family)